MAKLTLLLLLAGTVSGNHHNTSQTRGKFWGFVFVLWDDWFGSFMVGNLDYGQIELIEISAPLHGLLNFVEKRDHVDHANSKSRRETLKI